MTKILLQHIALSGSSSGLQSDGMQGVSNLGSNSIAFYPTKKCRRYTMTSVSKDAPVGSRCLTFGMDEIMPEVSKYDSQNLQSQDNQSLTRAMEASAKCFLPASCMYK